MPYESPRGKRVKNVYYLIGENFPNLRQDMEIRIHEAINTQTGSHRDTYNQILKNQRQR